MSERQVTLLLGVAVLASLLARYGGYASPVSFNDGLVPALWVGAVVVSTGAALALFIPGGRRPAEAEATCFEPGRLSTQAEAA